MARFPLVLLLLLLAACAGPLGPGGEPGEPAQRSLSALHWSVLDAAGEALGSATAVAPERLATARHVVEGRAGLRVLHPATGRRAEVARVVPLGAQDAALLVLAPRGEDPAGAAGCPLPQAGAPPRAGEELAAAGLQGGVQRLTRGVSLEGEGDAPWAEGAPGAARLPVSRGFSGGPVTDGAGRLVGMVVAAVVGSPEALRELAAASGATGSPLAAQRVLYLPASVLAAPERNAGP